MSRRAIITIGGPTPTALHDVVRDGAWGPMVPRGVVALAWALLAEPDWAEERCTALYRLF